jgi:hypothetical protein
MSGNNFQEPQQFALLHEHFQTILPRIELHGRICFRHLKCSHTKEDAICEMIGLAWAWFRRLAEQGKDGRLFPTAIATYAARAVKSGRRVCGQERAGDVLSPLAQQRHNFSVHSLPIYSTLDSDPYNEALAENAISPIPDQVQFRLDWPAWLATRTDRDRHIIDDMAMNERTQNLARKFGVSPSRISQLRREYREGWTAFVDALAESATPDTVI